MLQKMSANERELFLAAEEKAKVVEQIFFRSLFHLYQQTHTHTHTHTIVFILSISIRYTTTGSRSITSKLACSSTRPKGGREPPRAEAAAVGEEKGLAAAPAAEVVHLTKILMNRMRLVWVSSL
jgi:hypothetical protein